MKLLDYLIDALRPFWFRGKGRLLSALVPAEGSRRCSVFGYSMNLDLRDEIQKNIYLGAYEPAETSFVKSCLKPGMTFVDAGANVGYYTALGAALVGAGGRVYAIEPSPLAYERLQGMIRENQMRHAAAFPFALGSASGSKSLYLPPPEVRTNNPTMAANPGWAPLTVPVRTLDDCIAEWGIPRIDLLKIDIEGQEMEAFKGAQNALKERRIGALLCEFNECYLRKAGAGSERLYDFLHDSGFRRPGARPGFSEGTVISLGFTLQS